MGQEYIYIMEIGGKQFDLTEKPENMSKYIKYINAGFFFLTMACSNAESNKKKSQKENEYVIREKSVLSYLQSQNYLRMNDSAKWYLYNIYCDDTVPSSKIKSSKRICLSFLKLKPVSIGYSSDSLAFEIGYLFFYNDTIPLLELNTKYGSMIRAVSFDVKTKRVIGFAYGDGSYTKVVGNESRFVNPVQSDVIKFVKENKDYINEWYKIELLRHGVEL